MQRNFPSSADFTATREGLYQCSRADAGNWTSGIAGIGNCVGTMRGISAPTMGRWLGDVSLITRSVMQRIDQTTFEAIARAFYWRPVGGDALPDGVDLMMFDFAFNAGIARAGRMLQQIAGLAGDDLDGDIGPRSLAAIASAPLPTITSAISAPYVRALQYVLRVDQDGVLGPHSFAALTAHAQGRALALIHALGSRQDLAYRSFREFRTFGGGWLSRLDARIGAAVLLADTAPGGEPPRAALAA